MSRKRPGGGLTVTQQAAKFVGVSVLAGAVAAGLALPAVGIAGLSAKETVKGFDEIPNALKRPPLSQRTTILDANGDEIAKVYSRDRTVVGLKQMSPHLRKAIVAIEDARFYEHGAIDLKGVLRALKTNASAGEVQEGASTLTQQYVKNVFVEQAGDDPTKVAEATQPTLGRKIKELKYAIQLEQELTKNEILENYLNITFFGNQAYGVEAAAQRYFSTSAKDLTLPQSAMIAGIVQQPDKVNPIKDPVQTKLRRNTVLNSMAENGVITEAEAEKAKATDLGTKISKPQNGCITARDGAGFFCDYVASVMKQDPAFGKSPEARAERWKQGGLTIRTTLDPEAQRAAQKAVQDYMDPQDKVAAAITMVEPGTGRIQAMGQSRAYGGDPKKGETYINLSVGRDMGGSYYGFQPGSTFKAFTAAAALEKGISPAQTFRTGNEITVDKQDFRTCEGAPSGTGEYKVPNELEKERGTWDMTEALKLSINTYFVKLEQKVGLCETLTMAREAGFTRGDGDPIGQNPSLTLGVDESTPLGMASAYATFANRGTHCTPVIIDEVVDAQGRKLKPPKSECKRVMSERTADTINQMLSGVTDDGTGARAGLSDRDNAGKTGTTDSRQNAWFVGYTPQLASAVWVGGDTAKVPMTDITIGGTYYDKVCGGCLPGPIWRTAMQGALADVPATGFQPVDVPRAERPEERDEEREEGEERGDRDQPEIQLPDLEDLFRGGGGGEGGRENRGAGEVRPGQAVLPVQPSQGAPDQETSGQDTGPVQDAPRERRGPE